MKRYLVFICLFLFVNSDTNGQGCIAPTATINTGTNPYQSTVFLCSDGSNTITLTVPGGATDYSVIWQYRPNSSSGWTQLTVSPNNTQFMNVATFANAQPGQYRYQSGVSACGATLSPVLTMSAVSGVPSAPVLTASSTCGTPVTLSATSDNSAFQNTYYLQPSTIVSSTVTNPGTYYATATNVCGQSPTSNTVTIRTNRLQASGPIRLSDVNVALGLSSTSAVSVFSARVAAADAQVSKSAPYKLSSFYNYCY